MKRNFNVEVLLVHFPLHPETPPDGMSLEELFSTRGGDAESRKARQVHMKGLMEAEGLPYGERTHTYNSRFAQELGKWADEQPAGETIHDALYKAYFVDNQNIGDIEVLVEIARAAGLPDGEARVVLEERRYKDAVDADWSRSREIGVTGVPTFAASGYGVVGAQPYEALASLLQQVSDEKKERPTQ